MNRSDNGCGYLRRASTVASIIATALALAACGDNGSSNVDPPPDATTYVIGGTVTGLLGTGLVLQNNGGNDLAIGANGTFAFSTKLAKGAAFAVTVKTQPSAPTQTCSVSAGSGTVGSGNISSIVVNCAANQYTVGGTVSGLAGSGLILQVNGAGDLPATTNGSFAFGTTVASGGAYAVTVLAQPSNPSQTCAVTNGTGVVATANITNVSVACTTNTYTIGGTVTGLAGTGLVLQNNAGDDVAVASDGTFTFATSIASGARYAVTVQTQPSNPAQTCVVTGDQGTVGGANVTSVAVNCTTNAYTIGGTASGLLGTAVLQNNAGDNLIVSANGTFAFATPISSGAAYAVTVLTQPGVPSQTCSLANASGTVAAANVTDVSLTCVTKKFTVGGTVTGLQGTGLVLQNNNGDDLAIAADGAFTFATAIDSGAAYSVTVMTNPTGLSQTCAVASGTAIVGAANVTDVVVTCTTNQFTVGGAVAGLAGSGLVLQNNGGDDLAIGADGTFTFATSVLSGNPYSVTVSAQPTNPSQTCSVSAGSGTVTNGNVVTVAVNCTTNQYIVGGAVSGLAGTGLVLQNNAGDNLTVNGNGNFAFATPIASGASYAVTVLTQPTNPSQTCTVASGTGTVGGANVTTVSVSCTTNTYAIGGTVTGLSAGGLVLRNNGGDNLTINANGSFAFATSIASGATYAVTVFTQPSGLFCSVTNGTGTVGSAAVTNVVVTCQVFFAPVGPQQNVPIANLAGWTQCYIDNYNNSTTTIASIQTACSQAKIMMACRPTGAATLSVLAWANRSDVFTVAGGASCSGNNPGQVANGTKWYFDLNRSWGFAGAADSLNLCSCDFGGANGANRLCWHTSGSRINIGWRCGATENLNGSTAFERVIYQAP
jgi:hypothetical protein